jgi:hypothetical protein
MIQPDDTEPQSRNAAPATHRVNRRAQAQWKKGARDQSGHDSRGRFQEVPPSGAAHLLIPG